MKAALTPKQRSLARHALGLDGRCKQSYRNRFVTGSYSPDHARWLSMCARGFATCRSDPGIFGGDDLFYLTAGGASLALEPGESLDLEDFPDASPSPVRGRPA